MTTRGYYGSSKHPMDISTNMGHLEPRTSDPPSLSAGKLWFRSDLDDTSLNPSKWGELRLYDGSNIISIPVLESNGSQSGVDEAVQMKTKNGTGFVPIAELGDVSELEIQHSGSVWEFHDGQGPVVASGDTLSIASSSTTRGSSVNVAGSLEVTGTLEVNER